MKIFCYVGLLLLINIPFCYSQPFIIDEKYTGAQFVKDVNEDELIANCLNHEEFWWKLTNEERKVDRERCPLNTTTFDFNKLYDLLDKKTVIYRDGDFELVMDRKNYETKGNDFNFPLNDIVYEVDLLIVYKQKVKDTITLASYSYNRYRPFYLNTQYFYIDSNGYIYTLSLKDYSWYIESTYYEYHKIDKENLHF